MIVDPGAISAGTRTGQAPNSGDSGTGTTIPRYTRWRSRPRPWTNRPPVEDVSSWAMYLDAVFSAVYARFVPQEQTFVADPVTAREAVCAARLLSHKGTDLSTVSYAPEDYPYVYGVLIDAPDVGIRPDGRFDVTRTLERVRLTRLIALPDIDLGPVLDVPVRASPTAELADEVLALSGLTTELMSAEMGVSRRTFQAWKAGAQPSVEHERRLRQLRAIFAEANARLRTGHLRSWLLEPTRRGGISPHELLIQGYFTQVRRIAEAIPSDKVPHEERSPILSSPIPSEEEEE